MMLEIGQIIGFHGVKGEVKVNFSDRLLKNLQLMEEVFVYLGDENYQVLEIENYRVHKGNVLIKFRQYEDKTSVEYLLGAKIKQKKENLAPLEEEEYFIDDLIGLKAFDSENNLVGVVNSVLFNAASSEIIELKTLDDKIRLIPFVEELVTKVDLTNKNIVINPIPGLLDDEV